MTKEKMRNGLLAGMAGSAALNAATYVDMLLRNRPPSELPQQMVETLAQTIGLPPPKEHRRTALGSLLGYADGFSAGVLFGVLRPSMRQVPWYAAAASLAIFTMLLSEGSATLMGRTDPRKWGAAQWIADVAPRFVYGAVTTLTYDLLSESSAPRRAERSRVDWRTTQRRREEYLAAGAASARLRSES